MFVQRRDTRGARPRCVSSGNLNIKNLSPRHRIPHYLLSCVYLIYYQAADESKHGLKPRQPVTRFGLFNKVVGRRAAVVRTVGSFPPVVRELLIIHTAGSMGAPFFSNPSFISSAVSSMRVLHL